MELVQVIEHAVQETGLALVDVQWHPRSGLLQVLIERPAAEAGGITVEDCAKVSRQLTSQLEAEGMDYRRLEVSSPGLDRPLKTLADFQRFCGNPVKIKLRLPREGRKNFSGRLTGVKEQSLWMEVDGCAWCFSLTEVASARLEPQV